MQHMVHLSDNLVCQFNGFLLGFAAGYLKGLVDGFGYFLHIQRDLAPVPLDDGCDHGVPSYTISCIHYCEQD